MVTPKTSLSHAYQWEESKWGHCIEQELHENVKLSIQLKLICFHILILQNQSNQWPIQMPYFDFSF
jgi:hypothetical protein